MMYMLIGWTDGFGNDAYVKSVYQTREEALAAAMLDDEIPDKVIPFEFGEAIDFDYDAAEDLVERKEEIDWLLVAINAVDDDKFYSLHEEWFNTGCNEEEGDGDDVDKLIANHKDWLEEYYKEKGGKI